MKKISAIMPILALICLVCIGCSKHDNASLIGKWQNVSMPETVDFKADQTGTFEIQGSPGLAFNWEKRIDGTVRVNIRFQGKIQTLTGRIDKDTFILEGNNEQARYKKMDRID